MVCDAEVVITTLLVVASIFLTVIIKPDIPTALGRVIVIAPAVESARIVLSEVVTV